MLVIFGTTETKELHIRMISSPTPTTLHRILFLSHPITLHLLIKLSYSWTRIFLSKLGTLVVSSLFITCLKWILFLWFFLGVVGLGEMYSAVNYTDFYRKNHQSLKYHRNLYMNVPQSPHIVLTSHSAVFSNICKFPCYCQEQRCGSWYTWISCLKGSSTLKCTVGFPAWYYTIK